LDDFDFSLDAGDDDERKDQTEARHGYLKPVDVSPVAECDDQTTNTGTCFTISLLIYLIWTVDLPRAGPATLPTIKKPVA
jgi:hypothetical protein